MGTHIREFFFQLFCLLETRAAIMLWQENFCLIMQQQRKKNQPTIIITMIERGRWTC